MQIDQDKIRDIHTIVAFVKTTLESEDVERSFLARKLQAVIDWLELMENEKSNDKILNGLIIALNGIKEIENQRPKKYILEMKKRIIQDINYLEGR